MLGKQLVVCILSAPLVAQTTWVVDAGGGPGVSFADLPTALASPNVVDGDTLLVRTGPFNEGATPFTTSKGVTIVGDGGSVPLYGAVPGIEIVGLPAGRTFRLAGFTRPQSGELRIRVANCAGAVHLENLHADEPGFFFPTNPSIVVDTCASVTLRDVETFGSPAVSIVNSRVVLVSCRLGITSIGLAGGRAVEAVGSAVDVVQPRFEPVGTTAVQAANSDLRIGGDSSALLAGGTAGAGFAAIEANGGSVVLDPAVPTPTTGAPVFVGTAAFTTAPVPGSWTLTRAVAGQPLLLRSTAPSGAAVFQALGVQGPLAPTPLGLLGIDTGVPFVFFPLAIAPASGVVTHTVPVPATLPAGQTFSSQAVVWDGSVLQLTAPVTFTVH